MAGRKAAKPKPPMRDPTPAEVRSITEAIANQTTRPGRVSIDIAIDGATGVISNPHTDGGGWTLALLETFATTSHHFVDDALVRLSAVLCQCGGTGSTPINAALALIGGIAPQDEAQAAIAIQIATTHTASIEMASLALINAKAGYCEAAASYTGMATKLSRTMAAHVEALAKLRGGGRQIVEHRYIQVNAGNAVVGDNTQAVFSAPQPPGGNSENVRQPREAVALAYEPGAPMPCPQPAGEAMSVSGDARPEAMPAPRGQESGRAHGIGERQVQARDADQGNETGAGAAADLRGHHRESLNYPNPKEPNP